MMAADPKFYYKYRRERTKMIREREPIKEPLLYKKLQQEQQIES